MSRKRLFNLTLIIGLFMFSFGYAAVPTVVDDFTLKDVISGKSYSLSDAKDAKLAVIMFIATRCPVSNSYNERMVKLYDDYSSKNVMFFAINANKNEDSEECKEHATKHDFKFPVLKDINNKIADKYDAQVTPEIYVVNAKRELLYHGRIDNSQRESNVESRDLRNALDELLSGKTVSVKDTKAFGCTIKRVN
jgi:peroxiredoxin